MTTNPAILLQHDDRAGSIEVKNVPILLCLIEAFSVWLRHRLVQESLEHCSKATLFTITINCLVIRQIMVVLIVL